MIGQKVEDILLLACEGTNIHFYISPMRIHYYQFNNQLRDIIIRNLKSMIRITRNQTMNL
jgi:hypothetical protein